MEQKEKEKRKNSRQLNSTLKYVISTRWCVLWTDRVRYLYIK